MEDIRRQIRVVAWRLPLIIVIMTAFAGAAYVVTSAQERVYEAHGDLIVEPGLRPEVGDLMVAEQEAARYADLATRRDVASAVIAALSLDESTEDLLKRIEAETDPGSAIVTISARGPDRPETVAIVEALSTELIRRSTEATETGSQTAIDEYLRETSEAIARAQARIEVLRQDDQEGDPLSPRLRTELNNLEVQVATLQRNYAELLPLSSSFVRYRLRMIEEPVLPTSPVEPRPLFWTMLAALVGLFVATTFVFIYEYLEGRVRGVRDLERATDMPVLGAVVERSGDVRRGPAARLVTRLHPDSPIAEMYRNVMTSLISTTGDVASLAVTSAKPSRGKTATAANLAVSLAEAGFQVLIVDADLREPVLHEYFGLSNDRGLTTLLGLEKPNLADYIQPVGPRLAVVTAGPRHPNPASLIGSPRLRVIPTRIAGDADLVIVNAPELPTQADALMIGSLVQATLLVVSEGSRLRDVSAAVDALKGVPINMAGCVLHRTVRGSHPRPRAAAGSRPDQPKPVPVMSSGTAKTPTGAAPPTQASPGPYALGGPKSTR